MNLSIIVIFVCVVLTFLYTLYVDNKTKHLDFLEEFAEKHNLMNKEVIKVKEEMLDIVDKHNLLIIVAGSIDKKNSELIEKHNIMAEDLAKLTVKYDRLIEALKETYKGELK